MVFCKSALMNAWYRAAGCVLGRCLTWAPIQAYSAARSNASHDQLCRLSPALSPGLEVRTRRREDEARIEYEDIERLLNMNPSHLHEACNVLTFTAGPALPSVALDLDVLKASNKTQLSKHEQFRILDKAVALGCTFWNDSG